MECGDLVGGQGRGGPFVHMRRTSQRPTLRAAWLLLLLVFGVARAEESRAEESQAEEPGEDGWLARPYLVPDPIGLRERLEELDLSLELSYTGDLVANTRGGLARKNEYLGTVDATFTWHTETLLERDFGTLFLYGLWIHGGQPTSFVGDVQATDNIEAKDSLQLFEAWWQKSLFDRKASILIGLYDVNSEFNAIDSAEIFLHASAGMGAALGNSGRNGPSTFPATGLGARLKLEPIRGFELQLAAVDGVPGESRRPDGIRIDLDDGDGAFVIAEISHHRSSGLSDDEYADPSRPTQRRRVGRTWVHRPEFARFALGAWLYTAKQPHVSRVDASGRADTVRGHPGLYAIADYDAEHLGLPGTRGLSLYLQLGWADGDVGQFAGYVGGGIKYTGLLPFRPDDECGFAVAAGLNGDAFKDATDDAGGEPALAETALEWTYRASVTPWLSLQGDLQFVVNPGGVRDTPDALVGALRWVVDL